jgi:hypothetical protein
VACWDSGRIWTEGVGGVFGWEGCEVTRVCATHAPFFLQLLETFFKYYLHLQMFGLLIPNRAQFSLSRTFSPKPAQSLISGICTAGC